MRLMGDVLRGCAIAAVAASGVLLVMVVATFVMLLPALPYVAVLLAAWWLFFA